VIRTHDSRIKSPSLVRSDFEALTRFGEVTLRGRSNAKSPRRHPTLADEGIVRANVPVVQETSGSSISGRPGRGRRDSCLFRAKICGGVFVVADVA